MLITNNHDIAIELENILEKQFGVSFRHTTTIFSADNIEKRSFIDVINLLLHLYSIKDFDVFINGILKYKTLNMQEIPNTLDIYNKFLEFYKK